MQAVIDGKEIPADWCKGYADGAVYLSPLNEKIAAEGTQEAIDKAAEALKKKQAVCLLEAVDGAADGREKLDRLRGGVPLIRVLTADQTAEALGAGICVHTVLKQGGAADLFVAEARRFAAYCKIEQV